MDAEWEPLPGLVEELDRAVIAARSAACAANTP
jgi:hypothetical protein